MVQLCQHINGISPFMTHPSVNIFVLNWNGRDLTIDCLKSLEQVDYLTKKVIVIDNGSTDDSVSAIQTEFPHVQIIELDQNLGYAGGNNAGFKQVPQSDYTIFLNNDTTVDPNFVTPLVQPLEQNNNIMQTAPKIYYADDPNTIWFAGGKVNLFTGWIHHQGIRKKDDDQFNQISEIGYATGCCFCMRSKDFESLGMFDESFPMYGEDVDLSLRIRKDGGSISFVPDSMIWHKVSASLGGGYSISKWRKKFVGKMKLITKFTNKFIRPIAIIMALVVGLIELVVTILFMMIRKN